jgi:hypothetical protein
LLDGQSQIELFASISHIGTIAALQTDQPEAGGPNQSNRNNSTNNPNNQNNKKAKKLSKGGNHSKGPGGTQSQGGQSTIKSFFAPAQS